MAKKLKVRVAFTVVVDVDAYRETYNEDAPVEDIREYIKSAAVSAAKSELEAQGYATVESIEEK